MFVILFQFNELVRVDGRSLSKWTDSEHPQFIFELDYSDEQETKFLSIAGSHGVLLAYHGSSVENFHSILHNGLLNLFNKVHVLVPVRVGNCKGLVLLYFGKLSLVHDVRPDQINLLLLGFSDQNIGSSDRKKEKKIN